MTATTTTSDPRRKRRDAKVAQILDEAWRLARRDGLGGISLRDLAEAVGLRQPSLYVYFASKHDLYDAMFAQGNEQLLAVLERLDPIDPDDARGSLTDFLTALVRFATEDVVRHVLLFQRTIPGFEPSPESFAVAERFYAASVGRLNAAGVTDPADIDLFTALVAGLADQQVANDPGGDRWVRLSGRTIDMFLADVERRRPTTKKGKSR